MRILFASPERDLLQCYSLLLGSELGEVVTAFDGAQVMALLETEDFGLAVLDQGLPRLSWQVLLRAANARRVPAIVLLDGSLRPGSADAAPEPAAFLRYPFRPEELIGLCRRVLAMDEENDGQVNGNE